MLFTAPGVAVKSAVEQSEVHLSFIFKFFMISYFWVAYLFAIFIILAVVFFLGKRYFDFKKNNCIYQCIIFVIASFAAAFCMLAAPTSPERTWFCVIVFIVIAVGILYEKFDFENINVNEKRILEKRILMLRKLVLTVIIFATCNFIVMYLDTVMSTYEIRTQTKQREEYILSEKAKGNLDITTPIMSHKYPFLSHHDALYGLTDITEGPNSLC